ncbi:hypothetical protein [Candidatus Kuenenia sp.]|uniref:hypothetical protein n=1 Tax=Candidatus Kuenenia sp. TaxID=2499824 RepID=UPI00322024CA
MFKTAVALFSLIVCIIMNNSFISSSFAASPPAPAFGTATVDGDASEWNLAEDGTGDFFANMCVGGGNPEKKNPSIDAKLYLRYDCENEILYALVLGETGPVLALPEDNFIKLGNSTKLVDSNDNNDGTLPDFAWIGLSNGEADGWEAAVSLSEGAYNNLNVHVQVFADGEAQTAAVDGRAIELVIDCGGTTAVELIYFTANAFNGEVLLEWKTATEIDNAGFNIYRKKRIGDPYTMINEELIDTGGDAVSGATYSFLDFPDRSGRYFYTLEDIDTNGKSTMHGTIKVWVKVSE